MPPDWFDEWTKRSAEAGRDIVFVEFKRHNLARIWDEAIKEAQRGKEIAVYSFGKKIDVKKLDDIPGEHKFYGGDIKELIKDGCVRAFTQETISIDKSQLSESEIKTIEDYAKKKAGTKEPPIIIEAALYRDYRAFIHKNLTQFIHSHPPPHRYVRCESFRFIGSHFGSDYEHDFNGDMRIARARQKLFGEENRDAEFYSNIIEIYPEVRPFIIYFILKVLPEIESKRGEIGGKELYELYLAHLYAVHPETEREFRTLAKKLFAGTLDPEYKIYGLFNHDDELRIFFELAVTRKDPEIVRNIIPLLVRKCDEYSLDFSPATPRLREPLLQKMMKFINVFRDTMFDIEKINNVNTGGWTDIFNWSSPRGVVHRRSEFEGIRSFKEHGLITAIPQLTGPKINFPENKIKEMRDLLLGYLDKAGPLRKFDKKKIEEIFYWYYWVMGRF